ncbi:MAG TPA: sugar phosphate isomerase/epimerase [Bryobacteraceae bacterium]|nr:sugar phosphate isomerase/epimerase [Bryobacteraceae bacterium]
MRIDRRTFAALCTSTAALSALAGRGLSGLRLGVTDWNLRLTGKVEAVEIAKRIGFEGVEVSLGRQVSDGKLPLDDTGKIAAYKQAFAQHSFRPAGTCLDVLHVHYLKSDPLGERFVSDGVRITKQLGARVMLLPFFGKGAIEAQGEQERVGDVLRNVAPEAERAGIILGLEDTISAEANVRIMDRARSAAVKTYYDVGNSTRAGFDPVREIEWLGRKRICQFHLKDNPGYLGDGSIRFPDVLRAISRIGFEGFANLETDSPSKQVEPDMKRNHAFIRKLMAEVGS